jgi:hypothetical protein
LQLVLGAAALLVAWPWPVKLAALAAIVGRALRVRPAPTPSSIVVHPDATCLVPPWSSTRVPLGPRTVVCSHWLRLDLGFGPRRRDIVLFVDQLDPQQWASLRALLERARCDAAHVPRPPREPI